MIPKPISDLMVKDTHNLTVEYIMQVWAGKGYFLKAIKTGVLVQT